MSPQSVLCQVTFALFYLFEISLFPITCVQKRRHALNVLFFLRVVSIPLEMFNTFLFSSIPPTHSQKSQMKLLPLLFIKTAESMRAGRWGLHMFHT